jgi:small-conductance mechanosensitive channel
MTEFLENLASFVPLLGTIAAVVILLSSINWFLRRRWRDNPDAQFRFQLIMLALSFAGLLTIIVALPINDVLRGQLLSLIGILLSAAIALSSTTFIGNIMAGIMLKVMKNARPGDFITVADLTGRITEMDLLHTEIQTEFRDLVTVPNLYMVTQPLQVVRSSGTIIQAEVSLGYDVAQTRATELLCNAAAHAGLEQGFVQVRELGDYSVTYRVAGLLEDVSRTSRALFLRVQDFAQRCSMHCMLRKSKSSLQIS